MLPDAMRKAFKQFPLTLQGRFLPLRKKKPRYIYVKPIIKNIRKIQKKKGKLRKWTGKA